MVNNIPISINLNVIGPKPPYYKIAYYLWGEDVDFDSDGNSEYPDDLSWNELTLILRSDENQRIDIDPSPDKSDTLILRSENSLLANRVQEYLRKHGAIE